MTTTPTQLVRDAIDALNRRDWAGAFAHAAPHAEYDLSRTDSPLRGVYQGVEAVRRVAADFFEPWESVRYEPHDFIAAGENVVVPFTTHFRRDDGLTLDAEATWLWTFEGGELTRLTLYQDTGEALAAASATP